MVCVLCCSLFNLTRPRCNSEVWGNSLKTLETDFCLFHLAGTVLSVAKCARKTWWQRRARTPRAPSSPAPVGDFASSRAPRIKKKPYKLPVSKSTSAVRPIVWLNEFNVTAQFWKEQASFREGWKMWGQWVRGWGVELLWWDEACEVMAVWHLGRQIFFPP